MTSRPMPQARRCPTRTSCATWSKKRFLPTRSASIFSASANIIAATLRYPHRKYCCAGIAGRTRRIRLGSAVTVLSSDDPVRVFQRFATLDAISSGRAEVILGRGSFTESFPLFGLRFEAVRRTLHRETRPLCSTDKARAGDLGRPHACDVLPINACFPTVESGTLKTWVGVGGTPASVVRAASHGLPMVLAIIGGAPKRFAPYVDLYKKTLAELGKPMLPVGVHSPGHVADSDEQAREELWPAFKSCAIESEPSVAGVRLRERSSIWKSNAGRSTAGHRKRSLGKLLPPRARSESAVST